MKTAQHVIIHDHQNDPEAKHKTWTCTVDGVAVDRVKRYRIETDGPHTSPRVVGEDENGVVVLDVVATRLDFDGKAILDTDAYPVMGTAMGETALRLARRVLTDVDDYCGAVRALAAMVLEENQQRINARVAGQGARQTRDAREAWSSRFVGPPVDPLSPADLVAVLEGLATANANPRDTVSIWVPASNVNHIVGVDGRGEALKIVAEFDGETIKGWALVSDGHVFTKGDDKASLLAMLNR